MNGVHPSLRSTGVGFRVGLEVLRSLLLGVGAADFAAHLGGGLIFAETQKRGLAELVFRCPGGETNLCDGGWADPNGIFAGGCGRRVVEG